MRPHFVGPKDDQGYVVNLISSPSFGPTVGMFSFWCTCGHQRRLGFYCHYHLVPACGTTKGM